MITLLIYGNKDGRHPMYEQLLSDKCESTADIHAVKRAAKIDGYTSFRITRYTTGDKPDFTTTINRGETK